jgi:uncharacterized protein DUF1801
MAELKTKKTKASVPAFLAGLDPEVRKDCRTLVGLMESATGAKAKMWGSSIVGFGDYRYKYASGREGDWFVMGFAPRKGALTLYLMGGLDRLAKDLAKLGKHKRGGGCLYVKNLDDLDPGVLRGMLKTVAARSRKK